MPSPTTVFVGGRVRCGGGLPDSDALAVRDGRVVALGEQARRLAAGPGRDAAVEVVDLAGDLLSPAFGDGHVHPVFAGLQRRGPAISGLRSVDAVVAEVGRWAREHPDADWVVGGRYDPTLAPDGEFDARWLDAVVPDRPVVLDASDHHTVWCNSEALRRGGVDASTPQPDIGWIVRRSDGSPMGTLREWQATELVLRHAPPVRQEHRVEALADATAALAAVGITWAQDAWVEPDVVPAYLRAAREGVLATRVELALRVDPVTWREQVPLFTDLARQVDDLGHPRLTARTVKLFVDGVIEGGTATVLEPYADVDPCAAHARGMPVWQPDELAAAVAAMDAAGFGLHLHVIGDAAVRLGLDVLAGLPPRPQQERRPVLAHVQLVDPADLGRFAEHGVIANCEPLWAAWDPMQSELTAPRLGPERTDRQYPLADLLRHGARLSFGSDWPVTSHVPLEGIQVAVTRVPLEDLAAPPWVPEQRLTVEQALEAYSAGVAYQAFAEHERGLLRLGDVADLVRLSADPRTVDPLTIHTIEVRGTWLAGERTH
jgi:predicted amidohydrolase YtcJ